MTALNRSWIYRELWNSYFQICFSCISKLFVYGFFFITLDIYKDYFKGRLKWCNLMQSDYSLKLWLETICPSLSLSLVEVVVFMRQGFCNQGAFWSSFFRWAEELCSQHLSQVGVLVTYWDPYIDWLVTYLEPCIERRDCHYITSPIVYWGKGSTVGWYKVLGFLLLVTALTLNSPGGILPR